MAYNITGTAGNDTLDQSATSGPGTIVGLAGDDCIFTGAGFATVTGDSGNDTVVLQTGNTGTITAGSENDSIFAAGAAGTMVLLAGTGLEFDRHVRRNRRADDPGRQRFERRCRFRLRAARRTIFCSATAATTRSTGTTGTIR